MFFIFFFYNTAARSFFVVKKEGKEIFFQDVLEIIKEQQYPKPWCDKKKTRHLISLRTFWMRRVVVLIFSDFKFTTLRITFYDILWMFLVIALRTSNFPPKKWPQKYPLLYSFGKSNFLHFQKRSFSELWRDILVISSLMDSLRLK